MSKQYLVRIYGSEGDHLRDQTVCATGPEEALNVVIPCLFGLEILGSYAVYEQQLLGNTLEIKDTSRSLYETVYEGEFVLESSNSNGDVYVSYTHHDFGRARISQNQNGLFTVSFRYNDLSPEYIHVSKTKTKRGAIKSAKEFLYFNRLKDGVANG